MAQAEQATAWRLPFDPVLLDQVRMLDHGALLAHFNQLALQQGLVTGLGLPLQFVSQKALPADQPYEQFIARTGCVPTRDNPHDRYNALLWMSAPNTKAALNQAQAKAISFNESDKRSVTQRGPARDALTLWDENLAVIVLPQADPTETELNQRLGDHDWQWLFIDRRSQWGKVWQVAIFGHALLEKLDRPFKAITAHSRVIQAQSFDWLSIDHVLSQTLRSLQQDAQAALGLIAPMMFKPLPVMGIPGWHHGNDHRDFYIDPEVFRPAHPLRPIVIKEL